MGEPKLIGGARSRWLTLGLILFAATAPVFAHPHVFITNRMQVVFQGNTLVRIDVEWTFDRLFSQMILTDFDQGKKGVIEPNEAVAIKAGAFDNLKNFHYFLALEKDGKALPLPRIENFTPSISDGALVYRFSLPLGLQTGAGRKTTLRITVYDDTYYVAFDKMTASNVEVTKTTPIACAVSIEKTTAKALWPGQFMPDQVVLRIGG